MAYKFVLFATILILLDWGNMMQCCQKTLVRHLEMQIYNCHAWFLLLRISEHFCIVQSCWIIWTESNQTTKTPTLKRGSNDSGSSTSQSSSWRKFVRTWLKDSFHGSHTTLKEMLFAARRHLHWRSTVKLFCWVQWNNKLYFKHERLQWIMLCNYYSWWQRQFYISSCLNCLFKNDCFVL